MGKYLNLVEYTNAIKEKVEVEQEFYAKNSSQSDVVDALEKNFKNGDIQISYKYDDPMYVEMFIDDYKFTIFTKKSGFTGKKKSLKDIISSIKAQLK